MGTITYLADKLVNLVSNMGTGRDKSASSTYAPVFMTDEQAIHAYRGSWMARKTIDIPAYDSTRKWRGWQADKDQIGLIEAEEKRLGIKHKLLEAQIKARLFGGAAVFIGTGERDTSQPLNPERIGKGGIKYLSVMTRRQLSPTEIEQDVQSEYFGRPKAYRLQNSAIDIHPSRLIIFVGAKLPDQELVTGNEYGWGDSVLTAILESVKQADATMANIASMVFEAKVDVIRIPGFMDGLADKQYEKLVLERLSLAATAKGINGTLLLDKEEEYETKTANFGTLPDIMDRFLQQVCAASDIPATRYLSQAPAGMNASGESDLANYYDRIQSSQELDLSPAMAVFDECLIRSALGSRPAEIYYTWRLLWQIKATDKATIGKTTADMIKVLTDTKLFPEEALSKAAQTMLVEQDVVPGLETAMADYAASTPEGEEEELPSNTQQTLSDAAPRTLYVSRKVTNGEEILAWARSQGFIKTLTADDLHVTIAYSRDALDWMKVGDDWASNSDGTLTVSAGGARLVEPLGDQGAVVLLFNSSELSWRHMSIREAGASWDYEEYQPHITITYEPGEVDLKAIEPYRGKIEFGPEVFEELNLDWKPSEE
ncbi:MULTISPECIES: anti-CBASS protein Acb1 family protein [unclassified Pseudomonas]|uniref:anti-CBASS protein Acb1 family protein n=1 Tax=unclassified Pseudomonas TaxID=196821 RepID=UPI00257FC4F1|nr:MULTISPECIES: anti-CBASS Acb1 family protein [unclassified Pseudomonas]